MKIAYWIMAVTGGLIFTLAFLMLVAAALNPPRGIPCQEHVVEGALKFVGTSSYVTTLASENYLLAHPPKAELEKLKPDSLLHAEFCDSTLVRVVAEEKELYKLTQQDVDTSAAANKKAFMRVCISALMMASFAILQLLKIRNNDKSPQRPVAGTKGAKIEKIRSSDSNKSPKTKWWMIVYAIIFGLILIFGIYADFVNKYSIAYNVAVGVWDSLIFAVIFFGNLTYALNRVRPVLQKVWRFVLMVVVMDFVIGLIHTALFDHEFQRRELHMKITIFVLSFALYVPTFLAHYRIAYKMTPKKTGITEMSTAL